MYKLKNTDYTLIHRTSYSNSIRFYDYLPKAIYRKVTTEYSNTDYVFKIDIKFNTYNSDKLTFGESNICFSFEGFLDFILSYCYNPEIQFESIKIEFYYCNIKQSNIKFYELDSLQFLDKWLVNKCKCKYTNI